jgi:hypothetical protein
MSNADTVLLTGTVESRVDGRMMFKLSGEPYANAIVGAVAANYHRLTGRKKPGNDMLTEKIGQKVTLILGGENMLASSLLTAREGTLFDSTARPGRIGILPKGARKNGFLVEPERVLDMLDGYDAAGAAALVESVRTSYPELRNLTAERLAELPGEDEGGEMCTLALVGRWRMPDCEAPDAVWLIGEYWPEDDICDRCVLLLRPEHGFSEPGSVYGRQLLSNRALGEIASFEPISFRDAVELCNLDFDEAVAKVFGREFGLQYRQHQQDIERYGHKAAWRD